MTFDHRKSVTARLVQAARAHRTRAGVHLGRIGLHPGQESVLKVLADGDGRAMSELAALLAVQPPTVTKMIARLGAQGLVTRRVSAADGRQARVFLTETGRDKVAAIDRAWKRIEKEALAGLDDKDRKRLRRLLRQVERNLVPARSGDEPEDLDDAHDEALPLLAEADAPAIEATVAPADKPMLDAPEPAEA